MTLSKDGKPIADRVPRALYRAGVALAILTVLSAWGFADGHGRHTGLPLAVVSIFVVIVLTLTAVLRRIGRRRVDPALPKPDDTALDTQAGRLPTSEAALEIGLPIAAVAFGMLAFAIILHVAVTSS